MTTKPKTKEEAARLSYDEFLYKPATAVAQHVYEQGFIAGCEFIEAQLKEADGAYRLGVERGESRYSHLVDWALDQKKQLQKLALGEVSFLAVSTLAELERLDEALPVKRVKP